MRDTGVIYGNSLHSLAAEEGIDALIKAELEAVEEDAISFMYPGLPENTKCIAYAAGGASAEELAVFSAGDGDVQSVKELLTERVADRIEAFASYKPGDVPKLENAVIKSGGGYVIFCVCDKWTEADKLADELLG